MSFHNLYLQFFLLTTDGRRLLTDPFRPFIFDPWLEPSAIYSAWLIHVISKRCAGWNFADRSKWFFTCSRCNKWGSGLPSWFIFALKHQYDDKLHFEFRSINLRTPLVQLITWLRVPDKFNNCELDLWPITALKLNRNKWNVPYSVIRRPWVLEPNGAAEHSCDAQ